MEPVINKPKPVIQGEKLRGADKTARIPVKVEVKPRDQRLRKPKWIRARFTGTPEVLKLKSILREKGLHTVCEEAACPNLGECFGNGTATFMIMGDICTRRCPFCDVGHGRPNPLDEKEPTHLAETIELMKLKYVVITSVDRDDLRDGGAEHFRQCIEAVRARCPQTKIEILPRLYRPVRPGSDYQYSLDLLQKAKLFNPELLTKSGLMLGLGETSDEVIEVMQDMRQHGVDMLTIGQYLQPSSHHLNVEKYWSPEEFDSFRISGEKMGFHNVASAPMVRSSYHADLQAHPD